MAAGRIIIDPLGPDAIQPSSIDLRLDQSFLVFRNYTRGLIELDGFHPAPHTGPAMMRGLAASSGYAVIPYGGATAGSWVDWLVLP